MERLHVREVQIDWSKIAADSYLNRIQPVRSTDRLSFHRSVTFFTGENGSGKSTMLEGIAVAYGFNPEGGSRNYRFSTYDSHSELGQAMKIIRSGAQSWGYFYRAESFYNVATQAVEYAKYGGPAATYHERSHGEGFLDMAENYMSDDGFYLLDEPEAAVSPQRQLTFLAEIHASVLRGAQFIIATHSPILLGYPDAEILSFEGETIRPCTYEETGSYLITSLFLNNRERLLHELFN